MPLKLSPKDRDIIYCTQLKADAAMAELRKRTGYRDHRIRYCLQRALQQGLIRRRCFVNLHRLGLNQHQIYFSLSAAKRAARQELVRALIDAERVSWIGRLGGDFQYGMNVCATGIKEVSDFLDDLSSRFKAVFMDKVVAERISFTYFGNKYLSRKKPLREALSYGSGAAAVAIDDLDHRILSAVTAVEYRSVRELSRMLAIPQTTLDYRLKRLESQGVIVGYYYELQAELLGMQAFMLLVSVKGMNSELRGKFNAFCAAHPNIVIVIHSFGSWDFEIGVDVEGSSAIATLSEELHDALGAGLNWIKVLPSFGYPKVQEYPFRKLPALGALARS